jgi:N utilization substance protein B
MGLPSKQSEARNCALQFLYQCEIEKVYFFSETKFKNFTNHHKVRKDIGTFLELLIRGVLDRLDELDAEITDASKNWSLERIAIIDKIILRLAIYELQHSETPTKVVLNEAIELAKNFSTENSGKFINGLLDSLARKIRDQKP